MAATNITRLKALIDRSTLDDEQVCRHIVTMMRICLRHIVANAMSIDYPTLAQASRDISTLILRTNHLFKIDDTVDIQRCYTIISDILSSREDDIAVDALVRARGTK